MPEHIHANEWHSFKTLTFVPVKRGLLGILTIIYPLFK